MNHAFFMRGFECVSDLAGNAQRFLQRNRASLDALGQRRTLDQLHHQIVRPDVVKRANVGMIQRRNGPRLTLEALAEVFLGNLDGNGTLQPRIHGAIHFAHPPGSQLRFDLVRSDLRSGGQLRNGGARQQIRGWTIKDVVARGIRCE